jgi:hypothetical protein
MKLSVALKDNRMSGPKVVRVVTKQEVMAICRSQIDVVKDAIERWRNFASSHDALTAEDVSAADRRISLINNMFEREQFLGVQKKCAAEMAAIQADINRIREEAIAKAELERSKRRRLQYTAETLIKTLETASTKIPKELSRIVLSAITASESELVAMNAMLSQIMAEHILIFIGNESMTPLQIELSKKLSDGDRLQTLADWTIRHGGDTKTADADRRLDKLLAEIEAIENEAAAKPFLERVALIAKESSLSHRSLLTDSLIFDLVCHTNERKVKEQVIASMREVRCGLRRLTSKAAKDIEALLTKSIDCEDVSLSKILNEKGVALLEEETRAIAGISRREAVLNGLAELGYEVRENMATAWAEDGRIIVRKPNEKGYGVELGAVQDVERMQVQLVRFERAGDAHDIARDLDQETIWCSEFTSLKLLLQKAGADLQIEKALPVGSKPLKRVKESSTTAVLDRRTKSSSNIRQQDL